MYSLVRMKMEKNAWNHAKCSLIHRLNVKAQNQGISEQSIMPKEISNFGYNNC